MAEGSRLLREPERAALQFHLKPSDVTAEMAEVMGQIKQLAETMLYHWKTFPIVLPPSLTNQGQEKGMNNFRDLFVAPSFDELEQVATDSEGNLKKLDQTQLKAVWQTGEFEVPSVNFPGQSHRWRLTQLLQKGTKKAQNSLLSDSALALRLLIITARNRFISPTFSLSESVKSWGRGFWKILDILIGMPATSPGPLESKIQWEHERYLVAELDIKPQYREAFSKFGAFVKEKSRMSTAEKNKNPALKPPAIPYAYQTPKGLDIDLRLFNEDLINNCLPVLSNILDREAKGWYITFRQKMLMDLKGQGLSNEEISKRVNDAVKEEYLQRVYKAILSNAELESIESGIGCVLVAQAKSVIAMQNATQNLHNKMQKHKAELLSHLKQTYPVKSRISAWVNEQTEAFEREFILRNLWSVHEEAISLCEEENLHQAVYFLRRDLNFIKEREDILLKELSRVRIPDRMFTFSMMIWRPCNWITLKTVEGEETQVPTVIASKGKQLSHEVVEGATFHVNKTRHRKTSTRYPLWRWYNYLHRTWAWMWNSIFIFGVIVPWCSPLSFRALLYINAFKPNKKVSQSDGMLYPDERSTTQTLISRLTAIWRSVRKSRQEFESAPDRGFLGKSVSRHFNRAWNYIVKGALGSFLLLVTFPVLSVIVSSVSVVLAVTAPAWTPVLTLLVQLFCVLVYDFDKPGDDVNAWFIVFEAIVWRFFMQGTVQPVTAALFGFVGCPLASLAISVFGILRRSGRACWDTLMYYLIIRSRSRVPASNSFLARRIAGPGLASNYFLQIHPEQALAALEATMELEELEVWKENMMKMIEKPVDHFRRFASQLFQPFSATLTEDGVYKQLLSETSNYRTDLSNKISQRQWKLNTGLSSRVQSKVKLPEKQLKKTILQAAHMLEAFYPEHVIRPQGISEEDFWERKSLEFRDWTGLASQKFTYIFSKSFLVPLEATDSHFQLKVQHLNLARYITMLESAEVHDDLDIVSEVHTPGGEITTRAPHLDSSYFNPSHTIIRTRRYQTLRKRRFPWSRPLFEVEFDKLQVPLPVPHPAIIAISIYNREHELFAVNFDDKFCHNLVRALKALPYSNVANPAAPMEDNNDAEMSTPDNGVEPVSIVSHLAEQEKSISDDSTAPLSAELTSASHGLLEHVTPFFERKIRTYADEESGEDVNVHCVGAATKPDTASISTENEIGDEIYMEDETDNGCGVPNTP